MSLTLWHPRRICPFWERVVPCTSFDRLSTRSRHLLDASARVPIGGSNLYTRCRQCCCQRVSGTCLEIFVDPSIGFKLEMGSPYCSKACNGDARGFLHSRTALVAQLHQVYRRTIPSCAAGISRHTLDLRLPAFGAQPHRSSSAFRAVEHERVPRFQRSSLRSLANTIKPHSFIPPPMKYGQLLVRMSQPARSTRNATTPFRHHGRTQLTSYEVGQLRTEVWPGKILGRFFECPQALRCRGLFLRTEKNQS